MQCSAVPIRHAAASVGGQAAEARQQPSVASPAVATVLPEGFRFGVATCGYQVEGGHSGPGEPANNWVDWEREGRVEPSGIAVDFWHRYEEHLDRVVALGCDAFRLGVEWSRCEPAPGEVDDEAVERYRAILAACLERGLEPLVTLHHFTHPHWLGVDFWLDPDSPERFAAWVATLVPRLADLCTNGVTLDELNILALSAYWLEPGLPRWDQGVPVGAYYHWTLADNYEWGSNQPRFGLHGVDRERGTRILATDAHGDDSAGAYRAIIDGLRAGDRSVVA